MAQAVLGQAEFRSRVEAKLPVANRTKIRLLLTHKQKTQAHKLNQHLNAAAVHIE